MTSVPLASPAARPATLKLHPADDVVIAVRAVAAGRVVDDGVAVRDDVSAGHKIAVRDLPSGTLVRRYGQVIGATTIDVHAGEHVHLHNLGLTDLDRDWAFGADARSTVPATDVRTFNGIVRSDGRVATRNFIAVLTSVNCSATVARAIAERFRRDLFPEALAEFPNVDGVVALTHGAGCAIDSDGLGLAVLRRTLAGYAKHPNFAGVLVVGLGCETNQIAGLLHDGGLVESDRLHTFTIQDTGGTARTVAHGVEAVKRMLPGANAVTRQAVPASHLLVGLQCGGSDGYSGITANPALGAAVDLLVAQGGTAILSETPEIYGAEHLLTRRAVSREVGEKLLARFAWWDDYCSRNGAGLHQNPSDGNKAGGISTVLEKSLGGVTKGGTTNLVDVYEYAEPVTAAGLVFMDTPGYDPISATGQVAGGANLICFTTGRGSAYGCQPSPSLKLATNTALWLRQQEDIDLNCGGIVDGEASVAEMGERIFELMLRCASGARTTSEHHGYGQDEFVPWQLAVIT